MDYNEILISYRDFLSDLSKEAERLNSLYKKHMQCRKGCSDCCTELALLPLEWYALKEEVQKKGFAPNQSDACSLLTDQSCSFYEYRPLICRSHGLPLLYLIEEYNKDGHRIDNQDPDWQISWCDLNFRNVDEDRMEETFEPEDVINMEFWNTRLRELNREFLSCPEGRLFNRTARLDISDIFLQERAD